MLNLKSILAFLTISIVLGGMIVSAVSVTTYKYTIHNSGVITYRLGNLEQEVSEMGNNSSNTSWTKECPRTK